MCFHNAEHESRLNTNASNTDGWSEDKTITVENGNGT